ncbi:MAG: Ldh family oxidoreductase [Candidatus Freyarchaeum deiterrae]
MSDKVVNIDVKTLRNFMLDVFVGLGVPRKDADICAEVLITSDLWGVESHGIQRLKMYYDRIKDGKQLPVTKISVVKDGSTNALVDGGNGMGQVVAHHSMQMAIEKAKKYGTGAVAVRNSNHFGVAGYYAMMAVKEGMVGMAVTNARPSVAPTFGVEPLLGTNPLTFGCPTDEQFPFLIDCATSITQRGKIEVLDRADEPTSEGLVIGANGEQLTDTKAILKGFIAGTAALLPLGGAGETTGGHKGYGYSTLVEILSAAFGGGPYLRGLSAGDKDKKTPYRLGHFFLAINVSSFTPLDEFKKTAGSIVRELRNSKKAPGETRIYTAGEKEYEKQKERNKKGIPIVPSIQKDILIMRKELGLDQYQFKF